MIIKTTSLPIMFPAKREFKILKLFIHPHIIRLYEVIYTPTDIYVVMEYCKYGELFDYIVEKGRLQEDEARRIFQQVFITFLGWLLLVTCFFWVTIGSYQRTVLSCCFEFWYLWIVHSYSSFVSVVFNVLSLSIWISFALPYFYLLICHHFDLQAWCGNCFVLGYHYCM